MTTTPVRILVVDDSILMRKLIARLLAEAPDFEVVGQAENGKEALAQVQALRPDVVTLDIEMPVMNGIEFLKKLRAESGPRPRVLVLSSLTTREAPVTFEALELGAADFVTKPSGSVSLDIQNRGAEIQRKIREIHAEKHFNPTVNEGIGARPVPPAAVFAKASDFELLAIGASTGGPQSIRHLLAALPKPFPLPVIITQHMPEGFTKSFAETLTQSTALDVQEARDGQLLKAGQVLIAPGSHHLGLDRTAQGLVTALSDQEKMSGHRPSVDWLFDSVRRTVGRRALAVILTGMGADGAKQMAALHQAGAVTIGQSEKTCVVYGMPRVAASLGALSFVEDLDQIAVRISAILQGAS